MLGTNETLMTGAIRLNVTNEEMYSLNVCSVKTDEIKDGKADQWNERA